LFPENIGSQISIDETSLSQGELYTIVTNKSGKGRKGSLIAMVKGTDVETVCAVLMRLSRRIRWKVREVTLDMASNMEKIIHRCFPPARQVTDRFHVQKLAYEAVQEMRIKHRWNAIDNESNALALAKAKGESFRQVIFENGDTCKQLLARSRYLLFKKESLWGPSQRTRAAILFREYPDIKKAYYLSQQLGLIYHQCYQKEVALTRLARWYDQVDNSGFLSFGTVARSIQTHYANIINYFENRATNASAESFNAKIKAFRTALRGVRDIKFFIFRICNIFA
jgi:Transposase and inactivated derivatives